MVIYQTILIMKNKELAKIFYEIAEFLKVDDVAFKPYAYQKVAGVLESLEKDVGEIYREQGLKGLNDISGVGKNIALKIEEYLKTGKIKYYQKLKKAMPFDLSEITRIEGMGPRKAKILFEKLKIKDVKGLEKAAKAGKLRDLEGFGEQTENNILQGIEFLKKSKGRLLLGEIMSDVEYIVGQLERLKEVKKISLAGSLRRMKETIGDVDILVASKDPEKVMEFFTSMPEVEKIWGKGSTKSSVRMKQGFDVDLRVVPERSFGSALQYFTGSKEHNIATRKIAIEKGLKLNEYGVFKGSKMIAGKTEQEVYKAIGLNYISPEMREDQGEIEAAKDNNLPNLIQQKDIKGDLHTHSNWNGGKDSIEVMAQKAINLGYSYIGISDHTKFLRIENGLHEKELLKQMEEIDKLNDRFKKQGSKFRILKGCESNVLNDGSIDIRDEVLAKMDYVIAGVHSNLKMDRKTMTQRIITAMKNPHVDIIAHPTGRILQKRDEYLVDFDKVLQVAKQTKTILEISSSPQRLDLRDIYIRRAKQEGIKMIINTDAHIRDQLDLMEFGISQARRGWLEKESVVNTYSIDKLLKSFK